MSVSVVRRLPVVGRSFSDAPARGGLWGLVHQYFPNDYPLSEPLPGVPDTVDAKSVARGATKVTSLPNGVRVCSVENDTDLVCNISAFVRGGVAAETRDTWGASSVLLGQTFKATDRMSTIAVQNAFDRRGATTNVGLEPTSMQFTSEFLHEHASEIISLFADSLCKPAFNPHDINQSKLFVRDLRGHSANPVDQNSSAHDDAFTRELLLRAAFRRQCYARPSMKAPFLNVNADALRAYHSEVMKGGNVVVTGSGMSHEELISIVKSSAFAGLPSGQTNFPKAEYHGGSIFRSTTEDPEADVHVAVGFKSCGMSDEDVVAVNTLAVLLGGGASFSAGGPGKGMHTRIYRNVLSQPFVRMAAANNEILTNDAGVFYVAGSAQGEQGGAMLQLITHQLAQLAEKGNIQAEETSRAKALFKGNLLGALENSATRCYDVGAQVLFAGRRIEPEEAVKKIDALRPEDLHRVAQRVLSSKPTVAAFGYVDAVEDVNIDAL
eukprot:Rmarinus@m.7380